VKTAFQELPGQIGGARPVVDVVVEGLDIVPQACLIDTGAAQIRMGRHVAELVGLDLAGAIVDDVVVGGLRTRASGVVTELAIQHGDLNHVWSPTVYFCDPWPWAFGLFGLAGLDPFLLTLDAYDEWSELRPR
jgi:hypothetical protein